jgi:hypothetical protein
MSDFNVDWDDLKTRRIENGQLIPLGSDTELAVEFYKGRVETKNGTDFEEVDFVKIQAPGSKTVYDQPANMESYPGRPSDPERFPSAWAAYQAGLSGHGGTSIYEWEGVTDADARRFDLNGIRTVEQLARVSDVNLAGLGVGALALRVKAREFLSGNSAESALLGQVATQQKEIEKLTDVVNNLLEKLGETDEAIKAKPKAKAA